MTIRIHNESNINVHGTCTSKLRKPVLCIETGKIYASEKDAAKDIGVSQNTISLTVHKKLKHCKGMHFCFVTDIMDHINEIATSIQSNYESARKWDELTAKQEAERKAREEMENSLAQRRAKHTMLVAYKEKYEKARAKLEVKQAQVLQEIESVTREISDFEDQLGGSN